MTSETFGPAGEAEHRLLTEFRRAASAVPGYRTVLAEHGVCPDHVRDVASFSRLCPLLSKRNTFDRFPIDQLSVGGNLGDVADVLTSSGHGGRFSFGVTNRSHAAASAELMDRAFDTAFQVSSRRTLAINCLPMGVVFSSHQMTVATTSVREDMAVALIQTFGHLYDQLLLVGDPLFLKRFTDHARERGVDWTRYRVHAVIGEEIFGEHFRDFLCGCIGLNADRPDDGFIMSSFGVGELGLHLCYETRSTVALRRACFNDPLLARALLGWSPGDGMPLPMILALDPLRTFVEVVAPDADGYGRMTISMLDPDRTVPMLRYQTGDSIRLLDPIRVAETMRHHGVMPYALPTPLIALRGREREVLPNGGHVGCYKDALYANPEIARLLTGAFRMVFAGGTSTMHVQLAAFRAPERSIEEVIRLALPAVLRPTQLKVWPYASFPFGMTLDYERKFTHYVPGEPEPVAPETVDTRTVMPR